MATGNRGAVETVFEGQTGGVHLRANGWLVVVAGSGDRVGTTWSELLQPVRQGAAGASAAPTLGEPVW